MKILQIKPTSYAQTIITKRFKANTSSNKDVVVINSMLNPKTTYPQDIVNKIHSLDQDLIIVSFFISQVKKRNTLDWYSINEHGNKKIFLIVGDCATCTYKASQDIFELNERGLDAHLVTFSEMENLIIPKLRENFKNRILFMDDLMFNDNLFKQLSN
jgi:hypothetical protein|tara:strand:+ start:1534 stop:2007 length:474 start_codon:yes stop_codon:yes gene_type:complete